MIRSGLIGRSILSSRSPWLHEQEAKAQGFDLSYALFDFDERGLDDDALPSFLRDLAAQGYAGVNITYPFKQAVIPALDALSQSAELVGAVNTVAMRDGRLTGHNTDMEGFRESLATGLPDVERGHILLIGAGGAGAAVASALLSLGVQKVTISDVDFGRAEALAIRLSHMIGGSRVEPHDARQTPPSDVDGIVNATPIGMATHPGLPLDPNWIEPRQWVVDIIYFPLETEFLRLAQEKGCRTLNGSGMVIAQAARAFDIITGYTADQSRMAQSFL